MTIGINANEANVKHRVGIGQYAFEILKRLPKDVTVYLEEEPLPDMPDLRYEVFGPRKLWTLTGLQRKIILHPPDVLFSLTHYAPLFLPCPSVISVMDLAWEKFPTFFKKSDYYQLKYWTWVSAKQARKIITISEASKEDIIKYYKIPGQNISVAYPGYDRTRYHQKVKPNKKYGNYILYLGTLQPRKNLERLIRAFQTLEPNPYNLVIAGMINEGRGGWMNENIRSAKNIILTGYVPEEDKPGLYAGAKAFVLPSLYEGFGIPPVEAMACGTPVLVSKAPSLPEVCGEAATYIEDPYSVESIKAGLEEVLAHGHQKVKLGLEQVVRYNWDEAADKVVKALHDV